MIKELLDAKVRERGLSYRTAAAEIGVSHSTVMRVLKGGPADVPTLLKICKWLNVEPAMILNSEENASAQAVFSSIAEATPGLMDVLQGATEDFKEGLLTAEDLEEITSFIAFRLKARKEKDAKHKRPVPGEDR
jgi:transcriptional regulator with XRE-family HTH domain